MDDLQAAFRSPLRSFFGARRGTAADLRPGDLGFVGMPSDATHSSRVGTRFGPRALRAETSLLMAALGVAIGVGCVMAAYLDTPSRRPLFVPIGAGGLAIGFALLGFAPASFGVTMTLLALTGLVAGFYIIPLQSMLQALAPDDLRGRVLGTANGFSFLMGAIGSGLFFALRQLDVPSNRVFLVIAVLCAAVALIMVLWLRRGRTAA